MIIQHLASMCISKNDQCAHNTAKALDWIVALALLIIGVLGAAGLLPLGCALTYSMLGAGCVYTVVMIISTSLEVKIKCSG